MFVGKMTPSEIFVMSNATSKMIPFFFLCLWWEFNKEEFPEIIRNSHNIPLLVLCYSTSCNHCRGLPEIFLNISSLYSNDKDFLITTVNCQENPSGCSLFPMSGTPYLGIVIGDNKNYWPKTKDKTQEGILSFLNKYANQNPFKEIQIETNENKNHKNVQKSNEFTEMKENLVYDGSLFYFEVPENENIFIKELSKSIKYFSIYNDNFILSKLKSSKEIKLTIFQNRFCPIYQKFDIDFPQINSIKNDQERKRKIQENINEIIRFIEDFKFGIDHCFTSSEFYETITQKKSIFYIIDHPMSIYQKEAFNKLSEKFCDHNTFFGWATIEDQRQILKFTQSNSLDVPFLFGSDPKRNISWKYFKKLGSIDEKIILSLFSNQRNEASMFVWRIIFWFCCSVLSFMIFLIFPIFDKKDSMKLL
ncbi:hypothetical protein TRFO_11452 [Tritrichomonas foetus]|uniref:Thioredoxin domain-containing protein n=1 Tax=Tritrichomonas foetus TaxID=1144522 RepID=A0A1J4J6Z7_9EUKA|nr:hypothetical protein TRFO_11452 [Tritrichomonas foetus]|eukprot:OHS93975.1 hypothetical protein TRFO_11452 [Tritrichomonas foetus]